ncbi:TolC family protein [Granulicella sp. dw_53]|uniref:TolC family protein n=1 Tax=Granulicella sp. dw_53 TaxID=2719792 RepID=UPI001BD4A9B5|nr:TolC family protein [Granulicella sp. dw_53]
MVRVAAYILALGLLLSSGTGVGQAPLSSTAPVGSTLTLAQAESIAMANQPRLLAAQLRSRASTQRIREARSALLPTVAFNATGVRVADTGASTAAGAVTTSAISDRFAYGANLVQMVTDFGRTSALINTQGSLADARKDEETLTGAQIRLNVRRAYFQVMGAEAVLRAAREAQANRQLISQQVGALAQSQLRSTLDVNFANVLESEAELAVVRAESIVHQQRAHLASAMGETQPITAALVEEALPAALPPDAKSFMAQALVQRADLSAAISLGHAAQSFAAAEKRLSYPTLNVIGSAGQIPYHDHTLQDNYAAIGFNLNIPVFNGGLFTARRTEAELEAQARAKDVEEAKLEVNEQVSDKWYQADEVYRSLSVSARLVAQSREALRLAQARYEAGLGSIVELNEAQLSETSAEITAAGANYDYLTRRAELDYAAGLLN